MSTCVTSRRAAWLIGFAAGVALAAPTTAGAEEEALRLAVDATLGVRVYDLESPYDDDAVSSFFDQYRFVRDKDADLPYFVDLFHLDLGLVHDDGTRLLRFERWSPHALSERSELDVTWRGLSLDLDGLRTRNDELRVYPEGTFQNAGGVIIGSPLPIFGTEHVPDTAFGALFDADRRLFVRRQRAEGTLRIRPEDFGAAIPVLDEVSVSGRYESRAGARQDRFLLDASREPALGNASWRAWKRELDQTVTGVASGVVLTPVESWTVALDYDFERFREDAPVVRQADLAASAPGDVFATTPEEADRAFGFVPDTNRHTGTLRVSGRAGAARIHGGAFFTHLAQSGRQAPLQDRFGVDDNRVSTWSMHGAFDLPLGERFGLGGHAKFLRRDNDIDEDAFRIPSPGGPGQEPFIQSDPLIDRRDETRAGLELRARPAVGSQIAAGWRYRDVDRDLDFADVGGTIQPEFNLLEERSRSHTTYLRGRARLARTGQIAGEVGWETARHVGLAREPERAFYVDGNGSMSWWRPLPITVSVFGHLRRGQNDEIDLLGDPAVDSESKDFEQTEWHWGSTLSAVPVDGVSLFSSFVHHRDDQQTAYVRSNLPRTSGPSGLGFFLDSNLDMESELRTWTLGGTARLGARFDATLATSLTQVRVDFRGNRGTAAAIDQASSIRGRIASVDGRIGWQARGDLRLELGYRFDGFRDDESLLALSRDTDVHTFHFGVTFRHDDLLR